MLALEITGGVLLAIFFVRWLVMTRRRSRPHNGSLTGVGAAVGTLFLAPTQLIPIFLSMADFLVNSMASLGPGLMGRPSSKGGSRMADAWSGFWTDLTGVEPTTVVVGGVNWLWIVIISGFVVLFLAFYLAQDQGLQGSLHPVTGWPDLDDPHQEPGDPKALKALGRKAADAAAWTGWTNQHDELTKRFLAYESDLSLIARYPVMRDMADPLVVGAYRALTLADTLRRDDVPSYDTTHHELDSLEYPKAVREARAALDRAEAMAQQVGTSKYEQSRRRELDRAVSLIELARDSAAPEPERMSALRKAVSIVESVVGPVPRTAVAALEDAVHPKELTAG